MKPRFCQWSVRKMLIWSISDTCVVLGDAGLSGRAAEARRYQASSEFSAIRHWVASPPILGAVSVGRLQLVVGWLLR